MVNNHVNYESVLDLLDPVATYVSGNDLASVWLDAARWRMDDAGIDDHYHGGFSWPVYTKCLGVL